MSEQAEGWHVDASGLRVKKWDPHRATRRRGYERQLQQHQARRLEGATPSSYASNQPGMLAARAPPRAPRRSSRADARVGRAKKFNDRHAEALVRRQKQGAAASHRENDRYMADFRDAYGLAAPAEHRPAARAARPALARARRVVGQSRGRRGRGRRVLAAGPARPARARLPTAATGRSPCPCRTTAPTSSRAARTTRPTASTWRAPARSPSASTTAKARGHHEWVTGVAHCGGRSVATCGADGRLCLWRSPHACEELVTADGAASLSVLLADAARPQLLLAAGYDGTARLFDVGGGARARRAGRRPAAAPAARRSSAPPGTGRPAASATATAACSSTTSRPARGRGSSGSRRRGEFTSPRLRHTGRFPAQAPRGGGSPVSRSARSATAS